MSLTEQEVLQILRLVQQSSYGELRLETGDLKLVVRKGACGGSAEPEAEAAEARPIAKPAKAAGEPMRSPAPEAMAVAPAPPGLIPIPSPLLGTFYRRPSPDASPFVEVGSFVEEDDTVCIIEVMKVFTSVKAGVRGHIAKIQAENLQMVEYGQPLFLVQPEAVISKAGA